MKKSETAVFMDSDIMLGELEQTSKHKQLLDLIRVKRSKVPFAERWSKPGALGENTTTKFRGGQRSLSLFFLFGLREWLRFTGKELM